MLDYETLDFGLDETRCLATTRDLNHLGATGTASSLMVVATSWAIAQDASGLAILLGILAVVAQGYQWRKVHTVKQQTEPNADIELTGSEAS
jgi:hypothetical protein